MSTWLEHAITPVEGSALRPDGTPADLLNPGDYPCEAICLECGRPIRDERYFRGQRRHIDRVSIPPG
jgi:hypothetical protein